MVIKKLTGDNMLFGTFDESKRISYAIYIDFATV